MWVSIGEEYNDSFKEINKLEDFYFYILNPKILMKLSEYGYSIPALYAASKAKPPNKTAIDLLLDKYKYDSETISRAINYIYFYPDIIYRFIKDGYLEMNEDNY